MKTQDGFEYKQGKKYWYVSVDKMHVWLRGIPEWQPFEDWCMPSLNPILSKKLFVFKHIFAAHEFIQKRKPRSVVEFLQNKDMCEFDKEGPDHRSKLIDIINTLSQDSCEDLIAVLDELHRAQIKFPNWPEDIIHRSAIVAEESGELTRACLQYVYETGTSYAIKEEAVQTAAMAIRFLNNLIETKTAD